MSTFTYGNFVRNLSELTFYEFETMQEEVSDLPGMNEKKKCSQVSSGGY